MHGLRNITLVLILLGGLTQVGCAVRQADLTLVSTRLVQLDNVDIDRLPTSPRVKGMHTRIVQILFFTLPAAFFPNLEEAIDDALTKGGGDLLTDAVVRTSGGWFLLGWATLSVEGDVVDTRGRGDR